jgi:hypothetical protein
LESNSAIATRVIYFNWSLSRNWTVDSLRLFHFLPWTRAAAIAHDHYKCTREDWALAFRGLAVTYGALYDDAFQDAFQQMHTAICNNQIGHSFTFDFLEAYTSDLFYRLSTSTRTPTVPTMLPGGSVLTVVQKFTPKQWDRAFVKGFTAVTAQFDSLLTFQTYTLRRIGQPKYPQPSNKPNRPNNPRGPDKPPPPSTVTTTTPGTSAKTPQASPRNRQPQKVCFMSFLRHYKINMKTSNELPKKCEVTCKRLYYADLPKDFTSSAATTIAENTTLVSEENRSKLLAKIAADKKYS